MNRLQKFIEDWGLHIAGCSGIFAFILMAIATSDTPYAIAYLMGAGMTSTIYGFFWCEKINLQLLEHLTTITKNQNDRQRILLDSIRGMDKVIYDQDQLIGEQVNLMDVVVKELER